MAAMPVTRVVLYKHGVGYFECEGTASGDESITLDFKQADVSDALRQQVAGLLSRLNYQADLHGSAALPSPRRKKRGGEEGERP
jgi:hypothetical protein